MGQAPTVRPEERIQDVARAMLEARSPVAVVAGEDGRPVGVLTDRDFMMHGELPYSEMGETTLLRVPMPGRGAVMALQDARSQPARRLMRPLDAVLGPDDLAEKALDLMLHRGKRHIVVVDHGRLVGVVSSHDFVRLAAQGGQPVQAA
jgi:CBS domain-containing protein